MSTWGWVSRQGRWWIDLNCKVVGVKLSWLQSESLNEEKDSAQAYACLRRLPEMAAFFGESRFGHEELFCKITRKC